MSDRPPPRTRLSRRQSRIGCADSPMPLGRLSRPQRCPRGPAWTLALWRLRKRLFFLPEIAQPPGQGMVAKPGTAKAPETSTSIMAGREIVIDALGRTVGPDSEADAIIRFQMGFDIGGWPPRLRPAPLLRLGSASSTARGRRGGAARRARHGWRVSLDLDRGAWRRMAAHETAKPHYARLGPLISIIWDPINSRKSQIPARIDIAEA